MAAREREIFIEEKERAGRVFNEGSRNCGASVRGGQDLGRRSCEVELYLAMLHVQRGRVLAKHTFAWGA